ncbi:hypothetical protein [Hyunsoonleella rubra]|uniref:MFS transporter n=1 Tax=Hyunsoonleella rubra TaxID=1737062 RepID=A0ABW5TGS7_9FLAO
MLSIVLLYFIGKYYYELAQEYYKHRWGYGILGIVVYYAGSAIGGVLVALADDLFDLGINFESRINLMIIAFSFGVSLAVLVYFYLNRRWKKSVVVPKDEIDEIGRSPQN